MTTTAPAPLDTETAAQRARRQRIIAATLALASRGGYDAVQMREVAERSEVALGTASYHLRKLASLGFVELVAQFPRRGAIEHRYALTTTGRTQLAGLQPRSERPLSLPNVGNALRQLRERSGTSHTQLARAVGIDRSRIIAIEEGRDDPSVQTVINITTVLGGTLNVVVT